MKHRNILLSVIVIAAIAMMAMALTPPPPPPVGQNLGLFDAAIDHASTNATDQSACRQCHQTSGTNISGGYNNTIGGVPTRHHSMVPRGVINPKTGIPFGCNDCHPSTPGIGMGILLDRSCVDCHNGTAFNVSGAKVGNFSRPHHVNTSYTSVVGFGNPAAERQCDKCHGSFVANYNDSHYKPSYATDFMITPYASFKVTNFSQPDGLGDFKKWGGCYSCHVNTTDEPDIDNLHDAHHVSILGFGSGFQSTDTPFNLSGGSPGNNRTCFVCHVIAWSATSASPARFNITNPFTGEFLVRAMELRNSTIEATSAIEPGTTNITFNGTGCEKCHSVQSLHNIQFEYQQNGPQGKGHINNDLDCSGCHNSWLPASDFVPGALVPTVDSVSPAVIAVNTATTLTITGANFVNDPYTSVVTVDGVTYTPASITDTQITVDIPALSAGSHLLQLVKNGDTLSKLATLDVVPVVTLSSATLNGATLTLSGVGFGAQPATNAQQYVIVGSAGYSASITSWSETQIVAIVSGSVAAGDKVQLITADAGQATATIVVSTPSPTATPAPSITVTSPNGGESWKRGSTHAITWTKVGSMGANVKIELLKGTSATVIKSSVPNSGTYSWKISSSQALAANYKIRVTSSGTPSYTDTSNNTFTITR